MDTVYSPVSDKDEESETHVELPFESLRENQKAYQDAMGTTPDAFDLTPEEGAAEVTRRKQQPDQSPESASERPIVRIKSEGNKPLTLREAQEDLDLTHRMGAAKDLLAAGFRDEEVGELAFAERLARERGDPLAPEPAKVELPVEFGEDVNKPLNPEQAARKLGEWRQEQARQRQQELAELTGELQARQEQAQQPEQQPEQQPAQAEQPPDPVQLERQQVVEERQRTEAIKQLSFHEVAGLNNLAQLGQQVQRAFPELANVRTEQDLHNLHAHLQRQNPARAQALARADQVVRQRQESLAYLTGQRKAHEIHQQRAADQQRAAARAQQDAQFEESVSQHIPNWKQVGGEVRTQARETLKAAGLSENQIQHLWQGDHSIDAHSSVLQIVLAKAAQWDLAQQKAQLIRQSPLPKVIRPGTTNSSHGSSDDVASLRARMKSARGSSGLKLGVELLRAQRANRS